MAALTGWFGSATIRGRVDGRTGRQRVFGPCAEGDGVRGD
ncbi:hypothetical protein EDD40_7794 [Saccharothrix texasensis]|uniref:Uncharacterized protein n=1 Tax=Saccharothrix texasensis TaxID=103734 RepID=A0A3N1HIJ7_9PSEU|nr:hypothetical protein EDD40_7794 [Saccharothrix texasensis]